jgi:YVTN family beta-propeller protein
MTRSRALVLASVALATVALPLLAQDRPRPKPDMPADGEKRFAGPIENGFLLPNGWRLTPAGEQVTLSDLPLNILPLPDGKQALVATSGFNAHELSLINLETKQIVNRAEVRQSWFGLAGDLQAGKLWWSGGGAGVIHNFDINGTRLERTGAPEPIAARKGDVKKDDVPSSVVAKFSSGLALDAESGTLYSLDVGDGQIIALDRATGEVRKKAAIGGRPYDVVMARNRTRLYVSDWSGSRVLVLDPAELRVVDSIAVGEHPNQMVLHPTDGRLFVACASSNSVAVIDTRRGDLIETIHTALFPLAPEGSTPDALALAPDGETLYVANADNNCVAVIDVEDVGRSQVKGFIPTGWYPTAVAVTPDGKNLLVGVGKGNQTKPNPPNDEYRKKVEEILERTKIDLPADMKRELLRFPYIGTTLSGALSIVPVPDDAQLAAFTDRVYRNCPYADELLAGKPSAEKTAIPTKVGDPSPIKHVIYIIKENRTYDQVFGALPQGNGDKALVLFGREVTPNHHKLAEDFVLLDNLYCNGHVSADGHPWSTAAYNTDYLARNWALTYSRREGIELDDEAELAKSPSGYIWDSCARAGLTYRSYGEYGARVSQPDGTVKMEGRVPGLVGHICPDFGIPKEPGKRVRDTDNADVFLAEFKKFEENGDLPRFIVMSLGEDHTSGTSPGAYTPQACVASNDLALGRIVEAVSKSKYWPETAIFVIEDDAQNGPDHVDAHRTVGLVVSPYTKRKVVDSTQYQTVSMMRTMELILGLPPLSQFDAAAQPMFASFTDKADLTPYTHEPARIDLNAINSPLAYGADRSAKMDFSEYDRIDDFELNEILWRAIKGKDAPLPPAVRRAIAYRAVPIPR